MTSGEHQQAPGPGRPLAVIALSSITVQLELLDVLGPAFVRRHEALPYEVVGQTLRLVATHPDDTLLADEIAFGTGLGVEVAAPQGDGLPKVIEACIEAWSRGERTFVTTGAGGAVASADLVYLEDLGSLADSGSSSGPITFGEPGDFAELSSVGDLADVGAAAAVATPSGRPDAAGRPDTDSLPPVVDLKPRLVPSRRPAPASDMGGEAPSAHATTLEAGSLTGDALLGDDALLRDNALLEDDALLGDDALLEDDDLLGDVDLLGDIDLLDVDDGDVPATGEQSRWDRALTGVPAHRPAVGLSALLASGVDEDRRFLVRIAEALGFAVKEATRTLDVLEQLDSHAVDLLLLDADLAGTHPYTVARQLRAEERYAGLAIVVSGRTPRRWELVEDLSTTYGVDAYVETPCDAPTLLWSLETALAARRDEPLGLRDPDAVAQGLELLSQGASLYRKGAGNEAVDLFRRGLERDPFAAKLHVSLAIALVKQHEPYAAMDAFERAVWLDPTMTTALQNLAVLYEKKGFRNKAVELWTRTLHATKEEEKRIKLRARIAKLL